MNEPMAYLCNQYIYTMQFFKQRRTWNIHTLTVLVICLSLGSQILPAPFHSLFCDTGAGTQYAAFLVSLQASFMFGSANERHWWETGSWWGVDRKGEGGPFPVSVPVYFAAAAAAARGYDSTLPRFPAIPKAALQGLTLSRGVPPCFRLQLQDCILQGILVPAGS